MTIVMFNRQTGEPVDVPDEQVRSRWESGELGFGNDQTLEVLSPDGALGTIPGADVAAAFQQGFTLIGPEEAERLRINRETQAEAIAQDERLGGVGGVLRTFQERQGAAATLGLTDILARDVDPRVARGLEALTGGPIGIASNIASQLEDVGRPREQLIEERLERQEVNPVSAALGEVSGVLGPALATAGTAGGATLGARAAAGPGGALARGALATEQAVTQAATRAGAPRILARGAGAGAGGAVEGVGFEVGREIGRARLEDSELTGERLFAAGGRGAALGSLGGFTFGTAIEASAPVVRRAMSQLRSQMGPQNVERAIGRLRADSLGANARQMRDAARRAGGPERIGNDAVRTRVRLDDGTEVPIMRPRDGPEQVQQNAAQWMERQGGPAIGEAVEALDSVAREAELPNIQRIVNRVNREVLDPLRRSPFEQNVVQRIEEAFEPFQVTFSPRTIRRRVDATLEPPTPRAQVGDDEAASAILRPRTTDDAARSLPSVGRRVPEVEELEAWVVETVPGSSRPTFGAIHEARRGLDRKIHRGRFSMGADPTPIQRELRTVRSIIENELRASAGRVSRRVRAPMAELYRESARLYESIRWIHDVAEIQATRGARSSWVNMSDLAAIMVGAGGAPITALMVGLGSRFVRSAMGKRLMAMGLEKATRQGRLVSEVDSLQERLLKSVRRALTRKPAESIGSALKGTPTPEDLEPIISRFALESGSPEVLARMAADRVASWADVAPIAAAGAVATAGRAHQNLTARLPPRDILSMTAPHIPDPATDISDVEASEFLNYAKGVQDPVGVMEEFARGTATPEMTDGIRDTYPQFYNQILNDLMTQLAELESPPPYDVRLDIGMLFPEITADPSLRPDMLSGLQETFLEREGGRLGGLISGEVRGGGGAENPPVSLSEDQMTRAQELSGG